MGTAVVFPGQGTQAARMGLAWRATPHWDVVVRAEAALSEPGRLSHLLLDASDAELGRTLEAQLSVFVCSLMAWSAVLAEAADAVAGPGQSVIAFAGHSLGQLTALVAAGALSLDDGIRLVARRAAATQASADRRPGRMAALMGADLETAEKACDSVEGAWVANDNAPGQIVIGGTPEGVEAASEQARSLGVRRVIALKVGGAFHTPLFEDAAAELAPVLAATRFVTAAAPIVSNVDASPHTDPADWPQQLADHLVRPVRWRQSLETISRLGADSLVEVGPGNVLAGLARRTLPGVTVHNVGAPADAESLLTLEAC